MTEQSKARFATCINCMDGRAQEPAIRFLKEKFAVNYVDMITEPGPDKILAENQDPAVMASIKKRAMISVEKHASQGIVIVGHYDCAGNPVSEQEHRQHIQAAIEVVQGFGFDVPVLGVWMDEEFRLQEIVSSE